jgi:mRNA interferase RelE/StbE
MSEAAYTGSVNRSAQKEIRALDGSIRLRLVQSFHLLSADPRPPGCRKLVGAINRWRIRIGEYRVIYSIDDAARQVEIVAARHRSKAYD